MVLSASPPLFLMFVIMLTLLTDSSKSGYLNIASVTARFTLKAGKLVSLYKPFTCPSSDSFPEVLMDSKSLA